MTAWGVSPTQTVAMDNTHHFDFHWSKVTSNSVTTSVGSGEFLLRHFTGELTATVQWLKALKGTVDTVLTRSRHWSGSGNKATPGNKVVHCKHVSLPNVNLV